MDIERLKALIKLNCNISDSQFWGYYSICGLLMRFRELYRSEKSLMPWEKIPLEVISEWIAARETKWKEIENEDLKPVEINGAVYDPFEIDGINKLLVSQGFVYGGGYGRFNKPTFFLAELKNLRELYDYRIYYAGKELCRDLSASVAMLQGRCIFIRLETLKMLLWDKLQELGSRRFGGLLKEAFSSYGIESGDVYSGELSGKIDNLSAALSELFLLHELGEAFEDEYSEEWLDILNHNRDRSTEFYVRGIKDLLADTSDIGPLKRIIDKRDRSLLNFYVVFLDGIVKELFPEIMNSFQGFVEGGDWSVIEKARRDGYKKAAELRGLVLKLWEGRRIEDIVASVKHSLSK